MYEIKKEMLIPSYNARFPFDEMVAGDSIFIPQSESKSARAAAWAYGERHEMEFVTRTVEESGIKGLRIWRTA